jgi:hypothetical protein
MSESAKANTAVDAINRTTRGEEEMLWGEGKTSGRRRVER